MLYMCRHWRFGICYCTSYDRWATLSAGYVRVRRHGLLEPHYVRVFAVRSRRVCEIARGVLCMYCMYLYLYVGSNLVVELDNCPRIVGSSKARTNSQSPRTSTGRYSKVRVLFEHWQYEHTQPLVLAPVGTAPIHRSHRKSCICSRQRDKVAGVYEAHKRAEGLLGPRRARGPVAVRACQA